MWMDKYRNSRNEYKRRLYAYDTFYISQIIDIRSNGNAKRQNNHKTLQKLFCSQEEALLWEPFLEPGGGYCTIGLDENKIRKYVKYQEEREKIEEVDQQEFGIC